MSAGYSPRVDALLDRLGTDLTEQDFAALALACLDQAGIPVDTQRRVTELVEATERSLDRPARPLTTIDTKQLHLTARTLAETASYLAGSNTDRQHDELYALAHALAGMLVQITAHLESDAPALTDPHH